MTTEYSRKKAGIWTIRLMVILVTLLVFSSVSSQAGNNPADKLAPTGVDDSYKEIGVEWVNNYSWASKLNNTDDDAKKLATQLGYLGFSKKFDWGNYSAREEDWKGRYKTGGGKAYQWIETVDLAYFSGHGNSSGFYFESNYDDRTLSYSDCNWEWGKGDLDWVGLSACEVLADARYTRWAACMNGIRLLLGYKTTTVDSPNIGYYLGYYLRANYNFRTSWWRSAQKTQPIGRVARILAEASSYFNDKYTYHRSTTYVDNYYSTSTYTVCFLCWPSAQTLFEREQLNQNLIAMPVMRVQPLDQQAAEVRWAALGDAFGVDTSSLTVQELTVDGAPHGLMLASTDSQLTMDRQTGTFSYAAPDLFEFDEARSQLATRAIETQDARILADQFLSAYTLMPEGAAYVQTAEMGWKEEAKNPEKVEPGRVLESGVDAYEVSYARTVQTMLPNSAEPIEFDVVGPGAKVVVMVAPQVPAETTNAELADSAVLAVEGGFRQVVQAEGETVEVLPFDKVKLVFDQLESNLALGYTPVIAKSREILDYTLAYYEDETGLDQEELVPVYALNVLYTREDGSQLNETAFIPANPRYMAPAAIILTAPRTVKADQTIRLEAQDASLPLNVIGYDAAFDFTAGSTDPNAYEYRWYIGSASPENLIGVGQSFDYTVSKLAERAGFVNIVLEVTNLASPSAKNSSAAFLNLLVNNDLYLPLINMP